jgi:predicted nucleic acid-binding protein
VGGQEVKLVDTSSWIEYLRGHETEPAHRVKELIRLDQAGWCDLIALELWNGVRPGRENKALEDLEEAVTLFPLSTEVWRTARRLALRCRESGLTVPANDVIITACATHYALEIEGVDRHFAKIVPIAARL